MKWLFLHLIASFIKIVDMRSRYRSGRKCKGKVFLKGLIVQYTPRRVSPFMQYTLQRDPKISNLVIVCIVLNQVWVRVECPLGCVNILIIVKFLLLCRESM